MEGREDRLGASCRGEEGRAGDLRRSQVRNVFEAITVSTHLQTQEEDLPFHPWDHQTAAAALSVEGRSRSRQEEGRRWTHMWR